MAAPKGNKFAIGNSGRAKLWDSPEDLQKDIDAYFNECDDNTIQEVTKEGHVYDKPMPTPYTIEGLCDVLGCCRDTLLNYEKQEGYEDFFDTIKIAKLKIARNKLERGLSGQSNPIVTIFDLKNNHGYKDKTETDVTSGGESISQITYRILGEETSG